MFWERFFGLCQEHNIHPTALAKKIGLSANSASKWKKGSIPESKTLQLIADFFDVSVDYLLGKTIEKKAVSASVNISNNLNIMIELFKQLPEERQSDLINIARTFLISDQKIMPKAASADLV